jgi:5-methylthioribose kinase
MSAGDTLLNADIVPRVLAELGVFESGVPVDVEELTGGVSSAVFRATAGSTSVVLKQALPQLRVAQVWKADTARSSVESAAAELLNTIVPGRVPKRVAADATRHLFVMEAIAADRTWKDHLLAGDIDLGLAGSAGDLLGTIHRMTRDDPELIDRFGDKRMFDELRIDPYLRSVAAVHPSVIGVVAALVDDLQTRSECLVHADFSPKNLLVGPDNDLILVDHEVAHVGDPAFDLAFFLTHITAKALHDRAHLEQFCDAMSTFVDAYGDAAEWPEASARAPRLLAAIMLARVDGKSPLEYLSAASAATVRSIALELLHEPVATLDGHIDLVRSWQ